LSHAVFDHKRAAGGNHLFFLPGIEPKVSRPPGAKDASGMPGNTSMWCGWASISKFSASENRNHLWQIQYHPTSLLTAKSST